MIIITSEVILDELYWPEALELDRESIDVHFQQSYSQAISKNFDLWATTKSELTFTMLRIEAHSARMGFAK